MAGVDDVHFSILFARPKSLDNNPIMVAVPVQPKEQEEYYLVLAHNLRQFLSMGSTFGFDIYVDMLYDREDCIAQIESGTAECDFDEVDQQLLSRLRDAFGVFDFNRIRDHIEEVNTKYRHLLKAPS